ncbi:YlxR family protein [Hazenella sp. IB182357]|uniref:YlxR family protein n=1 Tax=Polycladospora coralii TaxID=2771432 RepID=A0A926RU23_9BACL|nr:YlxR family protein [Polycladospora coralii]MBD1373470.1 YlxR family protein [Polycladospora coralii]MBS7530774.1 YlxR family protein [Polycladospora coralii]
MKQRKIPMRKCVASQEMFSKKSLIRVVRTPENEVVIDPTGRKAGRGAYLCAKLDYIELAQKKRALERALKTDVSEQLYQELKEYVVRTTNHE